MGDAVLACLAVPSAALAHHGRRHDHFRGGNYRQTNLVSNQAGVAQLQDPDLNEGDILVCAATDPAWTALLALAAGAVIDNGGQTSHGAIVSRELGIPCVIGTGNGTSRIPHGARIRVDGDAGTVTVLSDG